MMMMMIIIIIIIIINFTTGNPLLNDVACNTIPTHTHTRARTHNLSDITESEVTAKWSVSRSVSSQIFQHQTDLKLTSSITQ